MKMSSESTRTRMTKLPQPYYRQGLLADHTEHGVAEAIRAGRGGAKVKELFRARARPPHLAGQFLAAEVAGGLLMTRYLRSPASSAGGSCAPAAVRCCG